MFIFFYVNVYKRMYNVKKSIRRSYGKEDFEFMLIVAIVGSILVNGLFFLVHTSRIALTFQFVIINYYLTKGFYIKKLRTKHEKV